MVREYLSSEATTLHDKYFDREKNRPIIEGQKDGDFVGIFVGVHETNDKILHDLTTPHKTESKVANTLLIDSTYLANVSNHLQPAQNQSIIQTPTKNNFWDFDPVYQAAPLATKKDMKIKAFLEEITNPDSITIDNGMKYIGETNQGKPYGRGVLSVDNNDYFIGNFVKGLPIYKFEWFSIKNGTYYLGILSPKFEPEHFGMMTYPSEKVYSGEFLQGKPHGQGQEMDPSKDIIVHGTWNNGILTGSGMTVDKNSGIVKWSGNWSEYTGQPL